MALKSPEEEEYAIRWYEPGDADGFLSLHGTVFGSAPTENWFHWRYDTPYLDYVPVVVAEADGEIVGALTLLPCRLRSGDQSALALQPANAMVHPDHRRQGLYSRIIDLVLDDCASGPPRVLFNFPTPMAKGAHLKMGWREVGRIPVWYRLHRPSTVVDREGDALGRLIDGAGSVFNAVTHRLAGRGSSDGITVTRHDGVPSDLLASIHARSPPQVLHVERGEEYYEWRYGNPQWDVETFVGRQDGDPEGAIITIRKETEPTTVVLADSVPIQNAERDAAVFSHLLSRVIQANQDARVLRAGDSIASSSLLWRYGFIRDTLPVASDMASRTEMVARPIDVDVEANWTFGAGRIDRLDDWSVALGDLDAP